MLKSFLSPLFHIIIFYNGLYKKVVSIMKNYFKAFLLLMFMVFFTACGSSFDNMLFKVIQQPNVKYQNHNIKKVDVNNTNSNLG